jgi:hypothetical protein
LFQGRKSLVFHAKEDRIMNGAAEAANQGGDFSGAMWAVAVIALVGFIIIIHPDIVTKSGWKWLFGLMGFFVRLFPEKWQNLVARLLGLLYIGIAVILGIIIIALGQVAEVVENEGYLMEMKWELGEMKTPYTIKFTGEDKVEISLPENPNNVFTFQFEDLLETPAKDVAHQMIKEADRYFGIQTASQGGGEPTAAPPPNPLMAGVGTEDLSTADRLIQEASVKWQAGDLNGSIQLAERAMQIKARILGEDHVKVLELKNQLQQAKTQALQNQIRPQQNP